MRRAAEDRVPLDELDRAGGLRRERGGVTEVERLQERPEDRAAVGARLQQTLHERERATGEDEHDGHALVIPAVPPLLDDRVEAVGVLREILKLVEDDDQRASCLRLSVDEPESGFPVGERKWR